jgi:predicted GH43/DUF377 family glycosyl hydrolase
MHEFAQAPATLVFDDFVRIYFSTRPPRDEFGQYVSFTGFVDVDRSDLMKIIRISDLPVMPLGEVGTFDEFGTYPMSVIRVGNEVWSYYGGWTRCESVPYTVSIGYAVSYDQGETFTKAGTGPLISFSLNEPMTISGPKIRKFNDRWHLYYVAGTSWKKDNGRPESIFKIRQATSPDGLLWERSGETVIPDLIGELECQASPDVIYFEDKYHMFFSYKHGSNFRENDRGYRLGYAESHDGKTWTRNDKKIGLFPSGTSDWDGRSIAYPHVFELDGNRYMLYLGNDVGKTGFGLAKMLESS